MKEGSKFDEEVIHHVMAVMNLHKAQAAITFLFGGENEQGEKANPIIVIHGRSYSDTKNAEKMALMLSEVLTEGRNVEVILERVKVPPQEEQEPNPFEHGGEEIFDD
jgi:hypothetical protein